MSVAGGISAQFGLADETTFNSAVTPTRFLEFNDESLANSTERIEGSGLRPNRRVQRSTQWTAGRVGEAGDVNLEVPNQGLGLVLKHMMGTIATSQPNAGSNPTVYEHKATVGPLDGKSFTAQIGRADTGGTVRAFTYAGCKVDKWELSCDVGGQVMLKLSLDGASESTAVALASAAYASNVVPLGFAGAAITIGGVAAPIIKFSLAGNNNVATDRYFMSTAANTKHEQLEGAGLREYTGSLDAEFADLSLYNKFINGTVGALTAFFDGSNISGTYAFGLELTLAAVRFDGSTPNVGGPALIDQTLPFKVLDSAAADGPVAMVYRTTDTTP